MKPPWKLTPPIWERHPVITLALALTYWIGTSVWLLRSGESVFGWFDYIWIPFVVFCFPFLAVGMICTLAMPFILIHEWIVHGERFRLWRWRRLYTVVHHKMRWFPIPQQRGQVTYKELSAATVPRWLLDTLPWQRQISFMEVEHGRHPSVIINDIDDTLEFARLRGDHYAALVRTESRRYDQIHALTDRHEPHWRMDDLDEELGRNRYSNWIKRRWHIWRMTRQYQRTRCGLEAESLRQILKELGKDV